MVVVKIKKIKDNAILPNYAHEGDAGVDLYSTEDYVLRPGERTLVSTGIKIALPLALFTLYISITGEINLIMEFFFLFYLDDNALVSTNQIVVIS